MSGIVRCPEIPAFTLPSIKAKKPRTAECNATLSRFERAGRRVKSQTERRRKEERSVYLAGTGLQTLTAIVPALVGCPEHSTLGHASSRLPPSIQP